MLALSLIMIRKSDLQNSLLSNFNNLVPLQQRNLLLFNSKITLEDRSLPKLKQVESAKKERKIVLGKRPSASLELKRGLVQLDDLKQLLSPYLLGMKIIDLRSSLIQSLTKN